MRFVRRRGLSRSQVETEIAQASGEVFAVDVGSIQAAVDALPDGGGVVRVAPGMAPENVVVERDGVYLVGANWGRGYIPTDVTITTVSPAGSGPAVLFRDCRNSGLVGVNVRGLGADVPGQGVVFENVTKGLLHFAMIADFADEGLYVDAASGNVSVNTVQVTDCLLDRTRDARSGAATLLGTDHAVYDLESTASVTGAVTSSNLYCAGLLIGSTLGKYCGVRGEVSDVGIYVTGDQNTFDGGSQADLNRGHGWVVSGTRNQFAACRSLNNSKAATNTYDGWLFEATGTWNQTDIIRSESQTSSTEKHRYGVNDLTASATQKNVHTAPVSFGATTGQYKNENSHGAAFAFPQGPYKDLTANSATPDVTGYTYFRTANTGATTITDFTGGVNGQEITVFCNDLVTTVDHNGSTISLAAAADKPLTRLSHYRFIRSGGVWRDVVL